MIDRMRKLSVVAVLVLCGAAHADPKATADALIKEGNVLAAQSDFGGAIAKYKAAALTHSRAIDDCNIGSAYIELHKWPQAQLFLDRCHSRATTAATTDFSEQRVKVAKEAMRGGAYAPIDVVEPAGATVTVSSFEPDETFTPPRVIWLAHGTHTLTITRNGFQPRTVVVDVPRDQRVSEQLEPVPVVEPKVERPKLVETTMPPPSPSPPPRARSSRRTWGKIFLIGGVGVAALGGVFHVLASRTRGRAEELFAGDQFDAEVSTFKTQRAVAIGGYALGGIAIGTGLYLLMTGKERAPVALAPRPGGAVVWLGVGFE